MMQRYINPQIEKEIEERGFCVYNYITFRELFLTVQKDYLSVLHFINIPFAVLCITSFIINIFLGLIVLIVGYFLIFTILFLKLLYRSYYFLLMRDVLYSKKGIIIGKQTFISEEAISTTLVKYENMFFEVLGKESRLKEIIDEKRKQLQQSTLSGGGTIFRFLSKFNGKEGTYIVIVGSIAMVVYTIFLYLFYYLGYLFGVIFFAIFSVVLKIIIHYTKNREIEIKEATHTLDTSFDKLEKIYFDIHKKIMDFRGGEISDISTFIEKNFGIFYEHILISMKQKDILIQLLEGYKHKDFIDLLVVQNYIKTKFNKPVKDMIDLMSDIETKLQIQMNEIISLQTDKIEYEATLKQKGQVLTRQLEIIQNNKTKFAGCVLS